jgi:4-hydroxy-tetrahydrodipicolinate synthase
MDSQNDELNHTLNELYAWLFCAPNPIPLNTMMAMAGLIKPVFRLPYVPLDYAARAKGVEILNRLNVAEKFPGLKLLKDDDFIVV